MCKLELLTLPQPGCKDVRACLFVSPWSGCLIFCYVSVFACYPYVFFMSLQAESWTTSGTHTVWTSTVTHSSTALRCILGAFSFTQNLFVFVLFFLLDVKMDNTVTHTHMQTAINYKPTQSWVKECRQTPELWVSSGTGPLGQLRYEPGDGSSRRMPPLVFASTRVHACVRTHTQRETTHVPTYTKADLSLLFLTHMHTMTHSQLSARSSHSQMHSWAHVCAGWTDADGWERWGGAPGTFAHPTHDSTQTAVHVCMLRDFVYTFHFV